MSLKFEIEIPGLPRTTNGSHGHWRAAAAERKKWRTAICLLASRERPSVPLKKAKITCIRYSSSEPDFDNLVISFKSCLDGLRDAGVIADDKKRNIGATTYLWQKAPARQGKIKIIVEEI